MLEKEKKFLDQKGIEYLWSKINMQDYPNNDTLIAVINAIDEGKMDKTTAIPLIEQAIAGQVPVVKSVDENGKPVEWEAGKFIKTINGKEPDENGNIKVRTPYEVTLSYYEGLVTAFNRTPQQIIEAERSSDKEVIYKLYIPIVTEDSETGPDIYATEVELKNANENYNSYKGYKVVVNFGEKHAPIIIDGSTDSFYIDETWVAPTTPSDIPETTKPNQYLTTNENGEKVWENKPDIAILQSAIDTLNGTGEGSVRDTVADAVATIVANAPEDFDTLKEVADWIANDETGTLNLIERVGETEKEIENLKELENIPVPATASVGQTIVVKSVDENGKPTEWETVDLWAITAPNGTKFKLTIDNEGVLTATEIV